MESSFRSLFEEYSSGGDEFKVSSQEARARPSERDENDPYGYKSNNQYGDLANLVIPSCRAVKVWQKLQAQVDKLSEARLQERPSIRT
ncbi:hypothetical protein JHK86_000213 [Glycine max]|nr:hypothetical protein JHK86_000213 [Glycine max]